MKRDLDATKTISGGKTLMNFFLALTGPAGSGKSTIAEKLAKQVDRCVNIDADHIKHMIVSGFFKDDKKAGGWSFSEWGLVGDSIEILVANFHKEWLQSSDKRLY